MGRIGLLSGALACSFLLLLAGYLAYKESAVLSYGSQTSLSLYESIETKTVRQGVSYYSDKRLMAGCITGMTSINALARVAEQNEAFAANCRELSASILSGSPADAFAWLISAQSGAVLKDNVAVNRGLAYSWAASRNEQWLAVLRIGLVEGHYSLMDSAVRENHLADVKLLAVTGTGLEALARYYRDFPDFRERVTGVMATMPDDVQLRFLTYVRGAVGQS